MAKTTMAQEVRVGAISGTGATGSSKSVRDWPAGHCTSIYGRRRTLRSGEGHGLDLRPATGHFIHRRAAMTVVKLGRRVSSMRRSLRLQSVSTLSRS